MTEDGPEEDCRECQLEAALAAAEQKVAHAEITAVENRLPAVHAAFEAFMEEGPDEGISAKLWDLMHRAAREAEPK